MPVVAASPGPVDIVLQGGGIKAIGLVGALAELTDRGFSVRRIAGASGGAIVAGLVAAGYSPAELRHVIENEDFPALLDSRWYSTLPLVGKPMAIFWRMGLHPGERVRERLLELMSDKGIRTFGDLHRVDGYEPLKVVVSDVTARRLLLFPRDARLFGIEPVEMEIAHALRMSSGIPVVYEPVRLKNTSDDSENLLVDGGMLSNFPLWVFDRPGYSGVPVLGLRLVDDQPGDSVVQQLPVPVLARTRFGQLVDYVESLARTMMEAHDRRYLDSGDYARTIQIPTLGVGTTEFDLPPERIEALHQSGRDAVRKALDETD